MDCPDCNKEMKLIDTTYSTYNSGRSKKGDYTGDIYECDVCDKIFINNFLDGCLQEWNY